MALNVASLDCFAVVAPGLEPFALDEALALGLPAKREEGGVSWTGDATSLLVANTGLRVASRVVVRLARFRARTFFELERHARRVEWAQVVRKGDVVRFRVTCKKSALYHSDAVAQRVGAAILRAVPGAHVDTAAADDDEESGDDASNSALFIVRLVRDECVVSADSSGQLLHRRGYRKASAKAPVRETIAAGMLAASGWDRTSPLVDPLCGSGTIPIEAALIARNIAPGARRTFAAEGWPLTPAHLGEEVRARFAAQERASGEQFVHGSDRDAGAIANARENAERAGVGDDISLAAGTISALSLPSAGPGWIVANPPYGIRVGNANDVRNLWAQLGNVLRERAAGWHVTLLSPDPALDRQLQIPMKTVASLANGGVAVRLVTGIVDR